GHPDALRVDVQHDLLGRASVVLEVLHEHVHHELLSRVVVVVQQNLVKGWTLDLLLGRGIPLELRRLRERPEVAFLVIPPLRHLSATDRSALTRTHKSAGPGTFLWAVLSAVLPGPRRDGPAPSGRRRGRYRPGFPMPGDHRLS